MGKEDEQFIENEIEMDLKHMKRCSTSFNIAETVNCPLYCLLLEIEPQIFPAFLAVRCGDVLSFGQKDTSRNYEWSFQIIFLRGSSLSSTLFLFNRGGAHEPASILLMRITF